MTDRNYLFNLRTPTSHDPLRIMTSACMTGVTCGFDGTANGRFPSVLKLLSYDNVKVIPFCPEEFSFGTPREMSDIHGGTGFDVLDGKAKVLSESGKDWTQGMIAASEKMLEKAIAAGVELAILMDISAACGSQVIYDGNRYSEQKKYQAGAGVAAAQLLRGGIAVISQRDYASLEILYAKIDSGHVIREGALDHHETAWYKEYFGNAG
jgi:uncharacterized protein YbbK (DUF523 family)